MTQPAAERLDRLRALYEQLMLRDPIPDDAADDREWDVWMQRVGADGQLAGLVQSALHGSRLDPRDLARCREASERSGSLLDAESVAEAYRLLGQR